MELSCSGRSTLLVSMTVGSFIYVDFHKLFQRVFNCEAEMKLQPKSSMEGKQLDVLRVLGQTEPVKTAGYRSPVLYGLTYTPKMIKLKSHKFVKKK